MRARRLVVAIVATLGVLSLAACGQSAPDQAAYVGDTTFSIKRVDAVYQDAQTRYADAVRQQAAQAQLTPSPEDLKAGLTRQDVANLLVSIELAKGLAAQKQFVVAERVAPEQLAQTLRMPPEAEFTKLWAQWLNLYETLSEKLPPAELSNDALTAVYDALVDVEAIQANLTIEQIRSAFGEGAFVRQATAVSAALKAESERVGTSINPIYRPVSMPALVSNGQQQFFYALPYVDADGPVTDISTPEAPPVAVAP